MDSRPLVNGSDCTCRAYQHHLSYGRVASQIRSPEIGKKKWFSMAEAMDEFRTSRSLLDLSRANGGMDDWTRLPNNQLRLECDGADDFKERLVAA
jgi:hypothetical protein